MDGFAILILTLFVFFLGLSYKEENEAISPFLVVFAALLCIWAGGRAVYHYYAHSQCRKAGGVVVEIMYEVYQCQNIPAEELK